MSSPRMQRINQELPAEEPEIGRALWRLEDARERTMQRLEGLDPALIDWAAPESGNSIGSILYHIAAIEADYLYADTLEQPFPQEVIDQFPYEVREENGRLTPVRGYELEWYLSRLEDVRRRVLAAFRAMDLADYRRVRRLDYADITPEWTLHHLMQHEAEHRGELASLRARAEAAADHPYKPKLG
jgi:uncharacterized damage-inducible protein DinB